MPSESLPAIEPRESAEPLAASNATPGSGSVAPARAAAPARPPRGWLRARWQQYVVLYFVGLLAFGAVTGARLWRPSSAPHFVFQADAWLHGHIAVTAGITGDDWAKIETVSLDDGSRVRGRRLQTRPMFRTLAGSEIAMTRVRATIGSEFQMSFPPLPAVLLLPQTLISGRAANDTLFTVLFAALLLPLGFALLRRLAAAGVTANRAVDDLWLVAALGFGTVFFFSAVQGKVWFTAHVVGVVFALIYAWASVEAAHPWIAGLALACAATTRTPMAFMFPLFMFEAWRMAQRVRLDRVAFKRQLGATLLRFALPVVVGALAAAAYNYVRFTSFTEFGHTYLDVRQQQQIERFGLFSMHYLARNLAVAFTLLPELPGRAPWLQIGGHGLALWFTTPIFLTLLWPKQRNATSRALWITVACVAIPTLFYQNSGWWQFGYRFSLDYSVFLIMLLAVGGRPLTRVGKMLIVVGVVVNLFGAVTFDRSFQYYRLGGNAYDVVVPH
ncbi:MAG: hypothetical protein KBG15_08625 [Kofleriaceae bacterium]|nr:hypothetical protein [Kofleriaceae bacterium]